MEQQITERTQRLHYLIVGGLLAVCLGLLISTSQAFAKPGPATIATDFPDANFQTAVAAFDADADGVLSQAELDAVTAIVVNNQGISSLGGIEYFTNLISLEAQDNNLASLDLSSNTKLVDVLLNNNVLTSIDLTGLTNLNFLQAWRNSLTTIDLSTNTSLSSLHLYYNKLTSIDLSANTALAGLFLNDNQLTSIDLSANTALLVLNVGVNELSSIDLSANTALVVLAVYDNALLELDLTNNTALTHVNVVGNGLLDITGFPTSVAVGDGDSQRIIVYVDPSGSGSWASGSFQFASGHVFNFPIPPIPGVSYDPVTGVFTTNVLYDEGDLEGTTFPFTTTINGHVVSGIIGFSLTPVDPDQDPVDPADPAVTPGTTLPPTGDNSVLPVAFAALVASCGAALLIRRRIVSSKQ